MRVQAYECIYLAEHMHVPESKLPLRESAVLLLRIWISVQSGGAGA